MVVYIMIQNHIYIPCYLHCSQSYLKYYHNDIIINLQKKIVAFWYIFVFQLYFVPGVYVKHVSKLGETGEHLSSVCTLQATYLAVKPSARSNS